MGYKSKTSEIELSIVMPCLNEAETVSICVQKAISWLEAKAICGEVIVADNGSTDGSGGLSEKVGARVVRIPDSGYGCALMGGIECALGKYVIIGDADGSYDFSRLDGFLEQLRAGYELVQGCRLPSGGGQVMPGAMPFLHRWIGNPFFSFLARRWFSAPIHDVYCGLRGFTREFYHRLNMQCTGMEFAVEMVIKASLLKADIAEEPITLFPDGRCRSKAHLRTFRDGWRTVRLFLVYNWEGPFFVRGRRNKMSSFPSAYH
jgi:glycosyltransferase involved in cell wall biosynthesis